MSGKLLTISIVLILIFIVASIIWSILGIHIPISRRLIQPSRVTLHLGHDIVNGEKTPILYLSTIGAAGCDSTSDLIVSRDDSDEITIEVTGYILSKNIGLTCNSAIWESRAKVNINPNRLRQNDEQQIIVRLNGQENVYKLEFEQYKLRLTAVNVINVSLRGAASDPEETLTELTYSFYPDDVAVLTAYDYSIDLSQTKDFRPDLINFAISKGFIPANQIYPDLQQAQNDQLYVVIRNQDMPTTSSSLGDLPGKTVNVYLNIIPNEPIRDQNRL